VNKIETAVGRHYGDTNLLGRFFTGLKASGVDLHHLQPDNLSAIEEFHIGGRKATVHAVKKMGLSEGQHILDIGCGIGGAARYMADQNNCTVTGIDLTPEYIEIAKTLTELTGLENKITFEVANALSMPFKDETFDAAITLHVAMNIPERAALYAEIARVLKPASTLYIFDVMKKNNDDLIFPVPWAETKDTSHLTTPQEMRSLLEDAGFNVQEIEDRTDFALDFFKENMTASAKESPPPGLSLIMGDSATEKLRNVMTNIESGCIAPVQMIATRNMS